VIEAVIEPHTGDADADIAHLRCSSLHASYIAAGNIAAATYRCMSGTGTFQRVEVLALRPGGFWKGRRLYIPLLVAGQRQLLKWSGDFFPGRRLGSPFNCVRHIIQFSRP
jgi:hypothetical protein